MYPHCTVRIRLLYAFNKYFDFEYNNATNMKYRLHVLDGLKRFSQMSIHMSLYLQIMLSVETLFMHQIFYNIYGDTWQLKIK